VLLIKQKLYFQINLESVRSVALKGVALKGVALKGVALKGVALKGVALKGVANFPEDLRNGDL